MRQTFNLWYIGLSLLGLYAPQSATAADIQVFESKKDRTPYLVITGDIATEDVEKLRRAIIASKPDFVFLDSRGGSTMAAIEMGKLIRLGGINTGVVPSNICASACGLIWLAGTQRVLSEGARVGFHATYTDNNGQRMESGVGNALVGHYLGQLSMGEKAIAFATSAPPNGMNWLTATNWRETGIDVKIISTSNTNENTQSIVPKNDALKNVFSTADVKTATAGGWEIGFDRNNDNTCYMKGSYEGGTHIRLGFATADTNNIFIAFSNSLWSSVQVGKEYSINIEFDKKDIWNLPTTAALLDAKKVLIGYLDDKEFLIDFAQAVSMTMKFDGRFVDGFKMTNSRNAILSMIECTKNYTIPSNNGNKGHNLEDPFRPR